MSYSRGFMIGALVVGLLVAGTAQAERIHGLAMHGDLKYPSGFTHFDYTNPDAPKGGEMRRGTIGTFDSFNPFIIKGNPASSVALIYDTLLDSSRDEPFSAYGLLAESLEVPDDRSWVIFHLNPKAKWHDGKPVTPEDVIWSFETLLEKGSPFFRMYYSGVEAVTKEGDRGIKFTFKSGDNRELPLILGQLTILPKHYWEGRDFGVTTLEPPLGSGPYKVGPFEANRFVSYERADDYWGRGLPVNKGRHNFDVMRIEYFRDFTVAREALKGGQLDFHAENTSKDWAMSYDTPDVARGTMQKREVPHSQPTGMQCFALNHRREIFQDPRVRQAIAYAFDFEWSNRTLFYGQYTRTRSYFENSDLASHGLPGDAELAILEPFRDQVPEEVFTQEYQPPKTDGSGKIRSNLKQAVDLLAQAGFKVTNGAMIHTETGRALAFEILLYSPAFERIVIPFARNLEKIGVKAEVRTVDVSQFQRRTNDFDFDVLVHTFPQSRSPGNEQLEFWGSEAADKPGSRNILGLRDPVVDELIRGLIAAPDRESLVAHSQSLDRVLQWGHHVVPNWHIRIDRIVFWDKFGYPDVTPDDGVQIDTWWTDAERAASLAKRRKQ